MKKVVIAFIAGALCMMSGQALAGTISTVGKKIQAEYPVIVDGKQIKTKAIAVNGTTFTPNAAIASAMGADVAFENKMVVFTTDKTDQMNVVNGDIEGIKKLIKSLEDSKPDTEEGKIKTQQSIDELKAKLAELEARKAELEVQP